MGNAKRVTKLISGRLNNYRFFLVLILTFLTVLAFAGGHLKKGSDIYLENRFSGGETLFFQDKTVRDIENLEYALGRSIDHIWTGTRSLSPYENAENHFIKHGWQTGHGNILDYVLAAHAFLKDPAQDIQTHTEANGDVIRFRPKTGEFAVMRPDGTVRTYYIRGQKSTVTPGATRDFDSEKRDENR